MGRPLIYWWKDAIVLAPEKSHVRHGAEKWNYPEWISGMENFFLLRSCGWILYTPHSSASAPSTVATENNRKYKECVHLEVKSSQTMTMIKKRKLWLWTFYANFGLGVADTEKEKEKQGKKMYLPIVHVDLVAWFGKD